MKTRENELHKPVVRVESNKAEHINVYKVKCAVCGRELKSVWDSLHYTNGYTLKELQDIDISYCPNCGARLKEI